MTATPIRRLQICGCCGNPKMIWRRYSFTRKSKFGVTTEQSTVVLCEVCDLTPDPVKGRGGGTAG